MKDSYGCRVWPSRLHGSRVAREVFTRGQRVRPTQEGQEVLQWSRLPHEAGTVVGFSRDGMYVRILIDGHARASGGYHVDFWEAIP